jgi:hypothetical protein
VQNVTEQLTPQLAASLTPEGVRNVRASLLPLWPSLSLVSRTDENGITVSRYRIGKESETRIVTLGLAKDGKVAIFAIEPDPDVR